MHYNRGMGKPARTAPEWAKLSAFVLPAVCYDSIVERTFTRFVAILGNMNQYLARLIERVGERLRCFRQVLRVWWIAQLLLAGLKLHAITCAGQVT